MQTERVEGESEMCIKCKPAIKSFPKPSLFPYRGIRDMKKKGGLCFAILLRVNDDLLKLQRKKFLRQILRFSLLSFIRLYRLLARAAVLSDDDLKKQIEDFAKKNTESLV